MSSSHLLIGVAAGLVFAASGVIGLIARAKVGEPSPRRKLYGPTFRLFAGLAVMFITLLNH